MNETISEGQIPLYASGSTAEYDIAQPRADAMIHSLRAFGYDLATALADLIDNSITANAKNIWLEFHSENVRPSTLCLGSCHDT